jgi:gamma-glutamyltranspeptidase/glutathione hydrolase
MIDWRQWLSDERMLEREGKRHLGELWAASSDRGIVASAHYHATRVGAEILEAGGNAVDAAVATSLALGVVEPAGSGIGGMATMTIHMQDQRRTLVLHGACRAPLRATPEEVASSSRRYTGYRAIAVPGYLAAIEHALRSYGTIGHEQALAPAIELARRGVPLTATQCRLIAEHQSRLARSTAGAFFLSESGEAPAPGTVVTREVLARTLQRLSDTGLRDFYEGEIAACMARDMIDNGGFIRADDLTAMTAPEEAEPVTTRFGDGVVCTADAPAGGRTLLEMLNLFSELASPPFSADSPAGVHLLAAIIQQARRDRRAYRYQRASDPDYTSLDFARSTAAGLRSALGEGETSHISVIDGVGNAVALTQSIERSFGAKVVTRELGFLYNGYMKAFKIRDRQHPHFLRPGVIARSNAAPTLVVAGDGARISIGSTGSERMISGIFQVLVRLGSQTPFAAVHAPRLHATPNGTVLVEKERFPAACLDLLRRRGFAIQELEPYSFKVGGLQLAARVGDQVVGVAEPRRDGAAAGPASRPVTELVPVALSPLLRTCSPG